MPRTYVTSPEWVHGFGPCFFTCLRFRASYITSSRKHTRDKMEQRHSCSEIWSCVCMRGHMHDCTYTCAFSSLELTQGNSHNQGQSSNIPNQVRFYTWWMMRRIWLWAFKIFDGKSKEKERISGSNHTFICHTMHRTSLHVDKVVSSNHAFAHLYCIVYPLLLNYMPIVENQAQFGLVCELTLTVNKHSNSQESPLCHHYVLLH